jgi:hypothetical protein
MAVAFVWIDDVMAGVDALVVSRVVVVATLVCDVIRSILVLIDDCVCVDADFSEIHPDIFAGVW